jgi:multidrug transporter EmrE-like cation transporter
MTAHALMPLAYSSPIAFTLSAKVYASLRFEKRRPTCIFERIDGETRGKSGSRSSCSNAAAMNPKTLSIALILFTVFTNAAAQIMLKKGMLSHGELSAGGGAGGLIATAFSVVFSPWVFAGLSLFVVSMASHLVVLSRVQLSFAYPFLSLAYVVVAAYAFFVFGEDVGAARIAGIALIMAGTVFISMS